LSYCPYQNIQTKEYPSILITAGAQDYRCPIWHVLKYAKRFRDRVNKPERITEFVPKNLAIKVSEGSHMGEVGTNLNIYEKSMTLAFLDYVITKANLEVTEKKSLF
jgi:protease II